MVDRHIKFQPLALYGSVLLHLLIIFLLPWPFSHCLPHYPHTWIKKYFNFDLGELRALSSYVFVSSGRSVDLYLISSALSLAESKIFTSVFKSPLGPLLSSELSRLKTALMSLPDPPVTLLSPPTISSLLLSIPLNACGAGSVRADPRPLMIKGPSPALHIHLDSRLSSRERRGPVHGRAGPQ